MIACATSLTLAVLAGWQYRESAARSRARVAALSAAIDGPAAELDTFRPESIGLTGRGSAAGPSHRWMMAAGVVPVALVVAALFVTRAPTSAPSPALRQPQSLELLAMRHDRAGDVLTVTGTVRVRGHNTAPVTAIVTGRDIVGHVMISYVLLEGATQRRIASLSSGNGRVRGPYGRRRRLVNDGVGPRK